MNSIGEAFIDNLKLLGFDPILHAVGMFNRILFDSNMFTHNADNNKAFEITSHFLFEKLDAQQTKKKFEHCWPITDYKIHSRLYRTAAYTWLQHLKCNGDLPSFVVVRRSYFEDCHGDHITDIMLALSTFVLHCNIQRELSTNDSLKRELDGIPLDINASYLTTNTPEAISDTLQSSIRQCTSRLTHQVSTIKSYQEKKDACMETHLDTMELQQNDSKEEFLELQKKTAEFENPVDAIQKNMQIVKMRLQEMSDYLTTKNCELKKCLHERPALSKRIREYEYGQLTHQLKLHDPISAVETLEDESFVLPSLIPVKNAINTSASVKQIITEMVSAENIEQGKKDRVDKKGSVDDTNHFSSKDSQKSFSMDIVDKNYESTKTPPNFISTKKQRVWPCSPHKNTTYEKPNHYSGMLKNRKSPGHYHVGEHSSPPFITTELPISGASSSGYLDILNKKENIYGKVISTTPYLNKNRSGSDSIERNSTSPFYPSNENLNSSMYGHTSSFDIYRKHSETYRQWHKRRRQSFGHRSLRPSDSSAEIINENVSCLNNSSTSPFQQALSRAMKMTSQQVRCYDESDPSETEGLGVLSYPLNISQPLSFHPITRQMITGRRMWEGEERVETFDLSNDTDLVGYWKGITTEEAAGYKSPSIPRTSMQSVLSVDHRPNLDTTKQPNCLPVSPMTYCYETEEVYDLFGESEPSMFYNSD